MLIDGHDRRGIALIRNQLPLISLCERNEISIAQLTAGLDDARRHPKPCCAHEIQSNHLDADAYGAPGDQLARASSSKHTRV